MNQKISAVREPKYLFWKKAKYHGALCVDRLQASQKNGLGWAGLGIAWIWAHKVQVTSSGLGPSPVELSFVWVVGMLLLPRNVVLDNIAPFR